MGTFTIVLKIFDDTQIQKGEIYCSLKFFQEIIENFPIINSITLPEIKDAFLIYARSIDYHKPAKNIEIKSIEKNPKFLRVSFKNNVDIDLTTDYIRRRLYQRLNQEHILKNIKNLPICCILTEEQRAFVFQKKSEFQGNFIEELKKLEQNNDWLGIYKSYKAISDKYRIEEIWKDVELLSMLGFAVGKLAETSEIPRTIFRDEDLKKKFLREQFEFRQETEHIRKRCIELNPGSPTYYSNLAYLYYQNSIELSAPKGRRDGNLLEEIDKAIEYFDKALAIDNTRITDLYRKGRLLADVKPNIILFGRQKNNLDFKELNRLVQTTRNDGIHALLQAVNRWEALDINDKKETDEKNRTRSSYIKSLYNLGNAYYDFVSNDWDESVFLLGLKEKLTDNDNISYIPSDLENINKAIESFQKCSVTDFRSLEVEDDLQKISTCDGIVEAVNKLYSIGKTQFTKYWILSGYGQKDSSENIGIRTIAKNYLLEALKCPWPKEKNRQNKHFIAERLARVYISSAEYDNAISVILNSCGNDLSRIQAFILNTLSLAYTLKKDFKNAHIAINTASSSKSNIAIWQSNFINGCTFLREGKLEEAKQHFIKADDGARKIGKQNVDSFLIAHAFVSYKEKNKAKAIEFLQAANSINPFRLFVIKKLQQWQMNP